MLKYSNLLVIGLLIYSPGSHAQVSETLLNNIRQGTDEYYITQDTLRITCATTLPCLEVYVNRTGPYHFLIDLGSNVCVFNESVIKEANVDVLIDRDRGDIVKACKLTIGNNVFLNVYGAAYKNLDVDGVIGYNLATKANFFMNYPEMQFGFTSDLPDTSSHKLQQFSLFNRMPYLMEKVGKKETYISFDTGADLWLYFPYHWKDSVSFEVPMKKFKEMTNNQTGSVLTYIGKIKEDVTFGNFLIPSPYVIFDPDIEDIYVGSSLLSQFKLIFYPDHKLVEMSKTNDSKTILIPENQEKYKE